MKFERTIDLAASPARVWACLTEPEQIKQWIQELVSDEPVTPPPVGAGTRTRMTLRERGRLVEYGTEILVYTPHQELVLEMTGGHLGAEPMRVSYRLTDLGNGTTRLVYCTTWRPRGVLLWLLLPLIMIVGRSNARRTLGKLAEVLRREVEVDRGRSGTRRTSAEPDAA
jgi:uncharacterized protein YndB with AHSA1/START domain